MCHRLFIALPGCSPAFVSIDSVAAAAVLPASIKTSTGRIKLPAFSSFLAEMKVSCAVMFDVPLAASLVTLSSVVLKSMSRF